MATKAKSGKRRLFSNVDPGTGKCLTVQQLVRQLKKLKIHVCSLDGEQLFSVRGGKVWWYHKPVNLMARILSSAQVVWQRSKGAVTQEQLFAFLLMTAPRYDEISIAPHFPNKLPSTRYICDHPEAGDGETLEQFIDFFAPATPIDRELITAMEVTPFWSGLPGTRPLFLIEAPDGLDGCGSGKSFMAQAFAKTTGSPVVQISERCDMEKLRTRLLSSNAATARIIELDNVKSRLSSGDMESLITTASISGHRMYVGEATRPNYFTYVVTANGAAAGHDIAQRSIVVRLRAPTYDKGFQKRINDFIDNHRMELWSDIAALFERKPRKLSRYSRWASWEGAIVARLNHPDRVMEVIAERQREIDTDIQERERLADLIAARLPKAAKRKYWISPAQLVRFVSELVPALDDRTRAAAILGYKLVGSGIRTSVGTLRRNPDTAKRGLLWDGNSCDEHEGRRDFG